MKIKFGHVRGGKVSSPITMADSEVIKTQSGRFIKNSSGTGQIAGATDDYICGFVESGDISSTSSDILNNIHDLTGVFMMPFIYDGSSYTTNYAESLKYTAVDLVVISNYQYIDLGTTTKGHVIVVDGLAATSTASALNDGYVEVMMNKDAFIS